MCFILWNYYIPEKQSVNTFFFLHGNKLPLCSLKELFESDVYVISFLYEQVSFWIKNLLSKMNN